MSRCRLFCSEFAIGLQVLSPEESHHAANARRLTVGDAVCLFDGAGCEGSGVISKAGRRVLEVDVKEIAHRPFEMAIQVTLAAAIPKGPRAGYLVEKCTELGVASIWPLVTDRSVVVPRSGALLKLSRRAVEAAKQSGRAWVPEVAAAQRFDDVLKRIEGFGLSVLADVGPATETLGQVLIKRDLPKKLLVFIGPEGGWSGSERARAAAAGVAPVSLGAITLRVETAAAAACAVAAGMTLS